jgi:hypothetical protein
MAKALRPPARRSLMRSRSVRWGELFIFIGVLVLALQYIDWKAFAPIERADLVIAGGILEGLCS